MNDVCTKHRISNSLMLPPKFIYVQVCRPLKKRIEHTSSVAQLQLKTLMQLLAHLISDCYYSKAKNGPQIILALLLYQETLSVNRVHTCM